MHQFKVLLLLVAMVAAASLVTLGRSSATVQPSKAADEKASASEKSKTVKAKDEDPKDEESKTEDAEDEGAISKFMRKKLRASNRILEGLMTEDFELISDNADHLLDMSHEESWRASNDMMYLQHSMQFRNAVGELKDEADAKSIDGASLEWIQVTMSCMQCHKWVRNIMLADSDSQSLFPQ